MATERSTSQRDAIAGLSTVLAASGSSVPGEDVLVTVLEVEGWNVARAAKLIEDDRTAERRRSGADDETIARSFAQYEQPFDMDESTAPLLRSSRSGSGAPRGVGLQPEHRRPPRGGPSLVEFIWTTLTLPFSIASSLLLFLARVLRLKYVLPGIFGWLPDGRPRQMGTNDPRTCAEKFIRELEDDTGGSVSMDANSDHNTQVQVRSRLPSFFVGGYNDALRAAKEQIKILAVVLVSREHGDVETFKKTTLVDPDLVSLLSRGDFIVWGGDVREREAYQVATTLQASTYPFVAFIALQPARSGNRRSMGDSSSSTSTPRPAVLSRLEGSPLSATSAPTIASHISDVLLPRTRNYLERLRAEQRRREIERELKAEQDRAYQAASQRDAERVMKKRQEEAQKAQETQRMQNEQRQKLNLQRQKEGWQRWALRHLVTSEPPTSESSIRLSFRLPSGKTLTRRFSPSTTLEGVFAFVETSSIAAATNISGEDAPEGYQHTYKFSLVTGYPRTKVDLYSNNAKVKLGDMDALSKSANLIVEGMVFGDKVDEDEDE